MRFLSASFLTRLLKTAAGVPVRGLHSSFQPLARQFKGRTRNLRLMLYLMPLFSGVQLKSQVCSWDPEPWPAWRRVVIHTGGGRSCTREWDLVCAGEHPFEVKPARMDSVDYLITEIVCRYRCKDIVPYTFECKLHHSRRAQTKELWIKLQTVAPLMKEPDQKLRPRWPPLPSPCDPELPRPLHAPLQHQQPTLQSARLCTCVHVHGCGR